MIEKRTWKEFQDSGLFWWINMILHTFGWAIVLELDDDKNIKSVFPARVKFRGFSEQSNTNGYAKVSKYMKDNSEELFKETENQ